MNQPKPLNEFTALELKKQIKKTFKLYITSDLSTNSEYITDLLSQLKDKHTIAFFRTIDAQFPGLSFHFIMEARHRENWEPGKLLLLRVSYFIGAFPEQPIFAPMRRRLIHALLFDDYSQYCDFFNDVQNGFKYIDETTYLTPVEKEEFKISLYKKFFKKYTIIYSYQVNHE